LISILLIIFIPVTKIRRLGFIVLFLIDTNFLSDEAHTSAFIQFFFLKIQEPLQRFKDY